ncbi:hypothetical protein FDB71_04995, partial [Clostridium botulinum]|nr:hypothetical protein [Clostridium botulinum]
MNYSIDSKEAKNGAFTEVKIDNKYLAINQSTFIELGKETGKLIITCYDVDEDKKENIITKDELINIFANSNAMKELKIEVIDSDPDNTINSSILLGRCYPKKYKYIILNSELRKIIFEFN